MAGLQLIVNTGKNDVISGLDCNALDSYLLDYGSNVVGATGSTSILAYLAGLIRSIRYRAAGANFSADGLVTNLVMHPAVWEQVAQAVACEYGLVCNVGSTTQQDAMRVADVRDRFIGESILRIDGKDYPVVLDNLIPHTVTAYGNGPKYCSDIYAITTMVDGREVAWGEYQDFNVTGGRALAELKSMFGATLIAVTDGGRFVHAPTTQGGFCFDVRTVTKPRLIFEMPWLSGRVQNVCVVPVGTYPGPTGSGLYGEVDGGASTKPYLGLYYDWESQQ
jgi:hypothetical protein